MHDRDVRTIRDLIFYQYAKIMTKKAFSITDAYKRKRIYKLMTIYEKLGDKVEWAPLSPPTKIKRQMVRYIEPYALLMRICGCPGQDMKKNL